MASILNADNGVVSGTSGLKYTSDNSGVIQLQTSGVTTLTLDTSKNAVFANAANVTGVLNAGNTIVGTLAANATTITGNVAVTGNTTITGLANVIGSDSGSLKLASTTSNNVNSLARVVFSGYDKSQVDYLGIDFRGLNGSSEINYGGGSGVLNAVQRHGFYTVGAANSTLGTERLTIANTGAIGINNTTPNSAFGLTVGGNTSFLNYGNTYVEFVGYGVGVIRCNSKGSAASGAVHEQYVYSTSAATAGNEVAYMAGGLSNTTVGFWNFQTKTGSSWNNTVLIRNGIFDVTGTINVSNTGTYAVGNTNIWYKTVSPSGSSNWIHGDHPISAFSHDIRSPKPSDFLGHAGQFLFTSYGLDNSSPYGDAIHVNSYNDSSGGDPNILVINKASNGVKVARGGWGSYTVPSSTQYSSGSVYTLNYTSASDATVKEDVQNITNGLDIIKQLRPVTYKWTDEYILAGFSKNSEEEIFDEDGRLTRPTNKVVNVGLIAQEVLQVLPTVVQNNNVSLPGTNDFLLNVSYEKIVPHLIAAIKEQQDIIEQLKTRMDSAGI